MTTIEEVIPYAWSATKAKWRREESIWIGDLMMLASGQQSSENGQIVNILGCKSHMVTVATTHFCRCSTKTTINREQMDMALLQQNII